MKSSGRLSRGIGPSHPTAMGSGRYRVTQGIYCRHQSAEFVTDLERETGASRSAIYNARDGGTRTRCHPVADDRERAAAALRRHFSPELVAENVRRLQEDCVCSPEPEQ
jgi:hypothetical protein